MLFLFQEMFVAAREKPQEKKILNIICNLYNLYNLYHVETGPQQSTYQHKKTHNKPLVEKEAVKN